MPAQVAGGVLPPGSAGFIRGPVCPGRQEEADLVDRSIASELIEHCEQLRGAVVIKCETGVYEINGRRVRIEMAGGSLALVVSDGPLQQGFVSYVACMLGRGDDAPVQLCQYAPPPNFGGHSALSTLPKEQRLTFSEPATVLDRFAAMCCASKQAKLREEHAQIMSARAWPPTVTPRIAAPESATQLGFDVVPGLSLNEDAHSSSFIRSSGAPWAPSAVGSIWSPPRVGQPFPPGNVSHRSGSTCAIDDAAYAEGAKQPPLPSSRSSNRIGDVHYC